MTDCSVESIATNVHLRVIAGRQHFFLSNTATTEIYTLSLHDALPIFGRPIRTGAVARAIASAEERETTLAGAIARSEEHTSELQSRRDIVCRLLLEKKKPQAKSDSASQYGGEFRRPRRPRQPPL